MIYDTLLLFKDFSLYYPPNVNGQTQSIPLGFLAMQAFARKPFDRSVDLLVAPQVPGDSAYRTGICMFRGGPHFGEKRIGYDSSDFLLYHPGHYGALRDIRGWPDMFNIGDITGTGNNVLLTGGGAGLGYNFEAMYVLGTAMDDKIDEFMGCHYCSGSFDTIRTTTNDIPTFIASAPVFYNDDNVQEVGTVMLLRGARDNIPVVDNPVWGVKESHSSDTSHHISAYPNPFDEKTTVVFNNNTGAKIELDVMNSAGQFVDHEETPGGYGVQEYAVFLNTLPAGAYFLRLSCPADGWSATTSVIKTGAAEAPWKLDLHSLVK
jgi:hypothetical protein